MSTITTRRAFLKSFAVLAASAFSCSLTTSCTNTAAQQQELSLFLFDTFITINAWCTPQIMQKVQNRCEFFESTFSRTREGSDVWRINQAAGNPIEVQSETADCIRRSLVYSDLSDGLFDITIGGVTELWDFSNEIIPSRAELSQAIKHIDYRTIQVKGNTVTLADPQSKIDLGGIAKGYIADDLARLFKAEGVSSALINLGGNVYALGTKPTGESWTIGVQDPNGQQGSYFATIAATDLSVVTSGLYERYFDKEGVRYHHILDPRTGYPAQTDLLSCSIASADSTQADALATVGFLVRKDKLLSLCEQLGVDALTQDAEGSILTTSESSFVTL